MGLQMNTSNIKLPRIKISIRIIAFILALIGLFFFYWTTTDKIPEVEKRISTKESENDVLEQTEHNLATLYQNMDFYLDETDRLINETEDLLSEFPTFMYLEDKILYADTLLKTDLRGYNLSSFDYGKSNYIMNVSYSEEKTMELYSVAFSGKYDNLTYTQIKSLLDYGLSSPQRFVMHSITMAYNDKTGYISGEFSFNTYFIPGQETPYEFPENVIVGLGNSNRIDDLFGARKDPFTNNDVAVEQQNNGNTEGNVPQDNPQEGNP